MKVETIRTLTGPNVHSHRPAIVARLDLEDLTERESIEFEGFNERLLARGGIVRRGLGYDWSDVGVLTNIGPDHIGQDGIETVEDIVHIKSLVAERVREGGTLVLNADDEHLARLTERRRVRAPEKKIVYFSLDSSNPLVVAHLETGGTAYYQKDGWIVEATGNVAHLFIRVNDIPVTMNGSAEFQVANLMAAAEAASGARRARPSHDS